jgi:thiol-disulfide isomerase/thioredoxin
MIDLARVRGNVVVVDFWATWSPASRNLLPELQNLATWADARGLTVRVLTVNVHDEMGDTPDEKKEAALAFWAEAGYLMPILLDYEGEAQFAYRVSSIPATFVIDPDGFVAMVQESTPDTDPAVYGQALRDEIVRLLEQ